MAAPLAAVDPRTITRPDPVLRTYYILASLMTGPGLVIALPMLMFKYVTLKYRFDDEGIAMSWGVLFRQETYLTYRRIQDIHVTRGIVQRWLGIATISVQTASGSTGAEVQFEGIVQYEALRDFLYRRMRGAHHDAEPGAVPPAHVGSPALGAPPVPDAATLLDRTTPRTGQDAAQDEALALLHEILHELRRRPAGAANGRGA